MRHPRHAARYLLFPETKDNSTRRRLSVEWAHPPASLCIRLGALTSQRQAVSVPCTAVAANILEPLDVEPNLLLQRGAGVLARRVVGNARGVQFAPDVLALRLAHPVEREVTEDAERGGQPLAARAAIAVHRSQCELRGLLDSNGVVLHPKRVLCCALRPLLQPDRLGTQCDQALLLQSLLAARERRQLVELGAGGGGAFLCAVQKPRTDRAGEKGRTRGAKSQEQAARSMPL
eukprot:CAMPEP_0119087344 /NCGR_PEP_ID=MMETSP1178-20130426/141349_1 /TAXON_ID=33656 /ORGANISM="unid sp, Strain CCMP2000" /LENGTH=232 /DNA_ID=CAMNT_0007070547 /DNA_START=59 /DNA_END=755 /DNA_ORIENTATION=-